MPYLALTTQARPCHSCRQVIGVAQLVAIYKGEFWHPTCWVREKPRPAATGTEREGRVYLQQRLWDKRRRLREYEKRGDNYRNRRLVEKTRQIVAILERRLGYGA